ncbi:hypothetical protein O9929_10680 [Vibrio lentus]|nr:hypothetical protein [Vibrio lentus]
MIFFPVSLENCSRKRQRKGLAKTAKSNVAEKDKATQKRNDKMLPDGPD